MRKEIYARALPKSIVLTETYCYEQEISRNPKIEEKGSPSGRIEVLVPYDGYDCFMRQAIRDVEQQIEDCSPDEKLNALIGYLAINEHDKTDLEDLLSQSKKYESIPLFVPVRDGALIQINQLGSDQHLCVIKHIYQPKPPELIPIQVDLQVLDDDISLVGLPSPKNLETLKRLDGGEARNLADLVTKYVRSGFTFGDASFRNSLVLLFQVRLSIPVDQAAEKFTPKIKQFSLRWPTSTSLSNLNLSVNGFKEHKEIRYDPLTKNLQWTDVQFEKDQKSQNSIWRSQLMFLIIGQPGELYQQASLDGEIEVEVPGHLLSGLQARFYGFNQESKRVGELNEKFPELSTRIITNFELILDEAFQKRTRSTSQELKFDQIFPDEECIRIIRNELNVQGFSVCMFQQIPVITNSDSEEEVKWLISAERPEGIDSMALWIVVHGIQVKTERTTRRGEVIHTSKDKSGELRMYLLGQFPRNSHSLIKKMKTLQEELRKKFEKLQRQS
jgi:hypothetical protein